MKGSDNPDPAMIMMFGALRDKHDAIARLMNDIALDSPRWLAFHYLSHAPVRWALPRLHYVNPQHAWPWRTFQLSLRQLPWCSHYSRAHCMALVHVLGPLWLIQRIPRLGYYWRHVVPLAHYAKSMPLCCLWPMSNTTVTPTTWTSILEGIRSLIAY